MFDKVSRLAEIVVDDGINSAMRSIYDFARSKMLTLRSKSTDELKASVGGVSATFNTPTAQEYQWVKNIEEKEVIENIMEEIQTDDVFWDIGANIGLYTCLIGNASGAEIVAFEPHPTNYEKLINNIGKNSLRNRTTTMKCGIGAESGEQVLYLSEEWDTKHSTVKNSGDSLEINIKTGDDVAIDKGYPDIVKIDVEGAEMDVLSGATQTLNQARAVYCEAHKIYDVRERDVRNKLEDLGFSVSIINSNEKTVNILGKKN